MKIKKTTLKKIIFAAIITPTIVLLGYLSFSLAQPVQSDTKIENGIQIIEFIAKNGYTPNQIIAKANIQNKIRVITKNTYDCSGVLHMPLAGINNYTLKPSGVTEFDLAPQKAGVKITGSCSSGANYIEITFV